MRLKLGIALVAALVFAFAATASASATGFLTTVSKAAILSTKEKVQIFTTNEGTVECSKLATTGTTGNTGEEAASQKAVVKYESCTAFGFVEVNISPADYNFLSNGEVEIEKVIDIEVPLIGCKVEVPAQKVKSVAYSNSGSNILLTPNVKEIHYTATGGCSDDGSFTNGTYTGTSEVMIASGTVSFMS